MKYLQNVFQGRSFLDCKDYTPAEIEYLITIASSLQNQRGYSQNKRIGWREKFHFFFLNFKKEGEVILK